MVLKKSALADLNIQSYIDDAALNGRLYFHSIAACSFITNISTSAADQYCLNFTVRYFIVCTEHHKKSCKLNWRQLVASVQLLTELQGWKGAYLPPLATLDTGTPAAVVSVPGPKTNSALPHCSGPTISHWFAALNLLSLTSRDVASFWLVLYWCGNRTIPSKKAHLAFYRRWMLTGFLSYQG